jgi:hypothetical protein
MDHRVVSNMLISQARSGLRKLQMVTFYLSEFFEFAA